MRRASPPAHRSPGLPWGLLAVAFALRILVVWWTRRVDLVLDEQDYWDRATFLLAHGHLPDAFRPPFYPAFVAAVRGVAGDSPTAVRVAQAVLATGSAAVLYRWLSGWTGRRGALLATAIFAFYPTFVGFVHLLWSETVYLSLLIFCFALLFPAPDGSGGAGGGAGRAVAAGVGWGAALLTRSVLLPLLPLGLAAAVLRADRWRWVRRAPARGVLFGATVALVVFPWLAHNRWNQGEWIGVEMTHGYNLWKGNTPWTHPLAVDGPRHPGPLVSIPMFPYEGSGERLAQVCADRRGVEPDALPFVELNRCARSLAMDFIRADLPGFFRRGWGKLGVALHPSSLLTRHLWLGYYGAVPGPLGLALVWGTLVAWAAVVVAGGVGLVRMPAGPLRAFLILFAAAQLGVIFCTFGNSRFRLPVVLVLVVATAWIPRSSEGRPGASRAARPPSAPGGAGPGSGAPDPG